MYNTLIVSDDIDVFSEHQLPVLTFQDYLSEFPKLNEPKTRVINLCDTAKYLSQGYYCSLLAQARRHRVLPSVSTINDLRIGEATDGAARLPLPIGFSWPHSESPYSFYVFFGNTQHKSLTRIADMAFEHYPCPILRVTLHVAEQPASATQATSATKPKRAKRSSIGFFTCEAEGFSALSEELKPEFVASLKEFMQERWQSDRRGKRLRWDMAILVNPDEPTPPSDDKAIRQFVKAAERVGFSAEVVTSLTPQDIGQYDALFIRETTAIDHHTYRLARAAEREGLVVMDDTQSILRCCNKVFLQDAFLYQQVPAPKSEFVSQADVATCEGIIERLGLPLVLKLPESSFSRGVYKVENMTLLQAKLNEMLAESALVLVQEYVFTEFDWRIGVLAGKPIYACQYFMARNHWQIYHHQGDRVSTGGFNTLPTFEVPKPVLQAAIKAAKVVGNGLYGVDLKQSGNRVYVIEVNDNPSIDSGVEDKYLGKELYQLIMQEFATRLEQRGR